ncbi:MAG: carbon-nitrogen family hydrolase [Candidatus Pristimantibacillus sp.]
MSQSLRIALLQMNIEVGNIEANFTKLSSMLEEAAAQPQKPDVIVFPEMWNTGYALTEINELADRNGERTKRFIAEFSQKHAINVIAGSIAESKGEEIYNTIYAFDKKGELLGDYSKIHLFRLMDEEKYLAAGDKLGNLTLEGTAAGMMICYDIRFPELARKLALEGAKLLFVPAEWPHPRLHHWRTLLTARAIENQMFVIACNRTGKSGDTSFFGHSMILDPWGETIMEAGEEEGIFYGDIDLSLVDTVRSKIPVFEDRRPTLY